MRHLRFIIGLALLLIWGCETTVYEEIPKRSPTGTTSVLNYNVVVLVIDGPRWTETFGDPSHTYVDHMWNELRPLGTLCTNFRNSGETVTVPGHTTILTGLRQNLANDGSERPAEPTLFEYFRKQTGAPASETAVVSGKPKLTVCAYSDHSDYGPAYGAPEYVDMADDYATYNQLTSLLSTDRPRLAMASFSLVDQIAHSDDWQGYLNQIGIVDSLVALTWNAIESDTVYAGRTYMFVTADHGRHDDAHGGFQNHGDGCEGCRHLPFLVLGPDIRAGYETSLLYTQRDVCATIGQILGINVPYSNGYVMTDIFEPVTSGILE
jgi:hypothetical protein